MVLNCIYFSWGGQRKQSGVTFNEGTCHYIVINFLIFSVTLENTKGIQKRYVQCSCRHIYWFQINMMCGFLTFLFTLATTQHLIFFVQKIRTVQLNTLWCYLKRQMDGECHACLCFYSFSSAVFAPADPFTSWAKGSIWKLNCGMHYMQSHGRWINNKSSKVLPKDTMLIRHLPWTVMVDHPQLAVEVMLL